MQTIDGKSVYSISEVNYFAKQSLEQLETWVIGEVQQIQQNDNWYYNYIKLIDENSVLPAICTRDVLAQVGQLTPGQKILVYGFPTLFDKKGEYKFKILRIEAAGEGLLQKQLEELVKKLKGEGMFDIENKKQIPLYPKKVCVVTSHGSDAWNDFKRHTVDKFPLIDLTTIDVRVQGAKSVPQLLKVLPKADKMNFDVIVITRGGGSLEDLAAFNDEMVARAIFKMETPTIVAIGHEANESLAEWVADKRASTPTDAASIVTFGYNQVLEKLDHYKLTMTTKLNYFSLNYFQRLDHNYRQLLHMKTYFKDLPHILNSFRQKLAHNQKFITTEATSKIKDLKVQMKKYANLNYQNKKQTLLALANSLKLLSPENILTRGYTITTDQTGKVIRTIEAVVVGSTVGVKLKDGRFTSVVRTKK